MNGWRPVVTGAPGLLTGCATVLVVFTSVGAGRPAPAATFTRDIAPVMDAACASCHRSGGPAPFSLITYDEVRRRATQIAAVTARGYMPPWKAEPESGEFVGQRRLTAR